MRVLRAWLLRLGGLFGKERRDRELADEIESNLDLHIEENVRAGMAPAEACRQALLKFGGVESAKERYRDRRGIPILETLWQDMRFGARMLRKAPGFTIVAVLTLALGIGANTAVFSMVNALLLHPYSFRDLDRIVHVWEDTGTDPGFDSRTMAPADAADMVRGANIFESLATYRCHTLSLSSDSGVLPVNGCNVSANFFDVLGAGPAAGRSFTALEDRPGSDDVAVIGYGFWQRQFGGDPKALGETIRLNGRSYTIIGIMPADFNFPVQMELWVPLAMAPADRADRAQLSVWAIGRLRAGVSANQARTALTGFAGQLAALYPRTNTGRRAAVLQLRRELYNFMLPLFSLLQLAAAFVLVLACSNLANLLFARSIGRQKEIALRTALGAGRRRLAQLFISETVLFSALAGGVAVLVSFWTVKLLRTGISPSWTKWVPGWDNIHVDATVLVFTVALAAGVGAVFGLAAMWHSGRVELNQTLKEGGPGSMTRVRASLRSALVVSQLMLALILLVCAGLTVQGFWRLANVYAGFRPESVVEFEPILPANSYANSGKIANFYQQLLRKARSLPGVSAAALIQNPPASNVDSDAMPFLIEGRPAPRPGEIPSGVVQIATPDCFSVLRIPLVSGRIFSDEDSQGSTRVVVVSRSMAARFWPRGDAVGQHLRIVNGPTESPWLTIIGVVDDVRQNWWDSPTQFVIYQPMLQAPRRGLTLLLRTAADPKNTIGPMRGLLRQLDPAIALAGVHTLQSEVTDAIGIIRILGILMGVFGGVALALSAIGVYGVLSEGVAQRTREIGIRVALGAGPREIRALVLGHALKLAGIGLAIAIPISLAANRAMASLVFGIVSVDFAVITEFALVLVGVAFLAGWIPARRAMRVDPMVALRHE